MHINANSEQHTQSIGKLLKNISTKPECVKEFGRWGLEISSEILLVRLTSSCVMSQNDKLMRVPTPSTHFTRAVPMLFLSLQMKGRTLPMENICMKSSSFAAGTDGRWSSKIVRDASISSVSAALA